MESAASLVGEVKKHDRFTVEFVGYWCWIYRCSDYLQQNGRNIVRVKPWIEGLFGGQDDVFDAARRAR